MNFNPYPYGESMENYEKYDTYQKVVGKPGGFTSKHIWKTCDTTDQQCR